MKELPVNTLPVKRILRAVHDAAERWKNADFPPRVRVTANLIARTGYSEPVIDYALDRLFSSCTTSAIELAISGELGDLSALDGFIARKDRPSLYARGLRRVAIISSQSTIGVALPAAIFAILAKCHVLVKDREDGLIRQFFATLVQEDPALADFVLAKIWDGNSTDNEYQDCDIVVAFGRSETLQTIRQSLGRETRFIGFGPRISCGVLSAEDLVSVADQHHVFTAAARDAILYDAEGCMSLHVVFAQMPVTDKPEDSRLDEHSALHQLCDGLSQALADSAIEFPLAQRTSEERLQHAAASSSLRFRAAARNELLRERPIGTVIVSHDHPPLLMPASIVVVPLHQLQVEAVSVTSHESSRLELALATGAVRITNYGAMQNPPLYGEHGGRPRILDFVDLVTLEEAA
jgi:hypothetical protein